MESIDFFVVVMLLAKKSYDWLKSESEALLHQKNNLPNPHFPIFYAKFIWIYLFTCGYFFYPSFLLFSVRKRFPGTPVSSHWPESRLLLPSCCLLFMLSVAAQSWGRTFGLIAVFGLGPVWPWLWMSPPPVVISRSLSLSSCPSSSLMFCFLPSFFTFVALHRKKKMFTREPSLMQTCCNSVRLSSLK